VLIDPYDETEFLDFERRTGLPASGMRKFAPTNDANVVPWYHRMELRRVRFGCGADTPNMAYLLTKALRLVALTKALRLVASTHWAPRRPYATTGASSPSKGLYSDPWLPPCSRFRISP
jgi:hypothetical protein